MIPDEGMGEAGGGLSLSRAGGLGNWISELQTGQWAVVP